MEGVTEGLRAAAVATAAATCSSTRNCTAAECTDGGKAGTAQHDEEDVDEVEDEEHEEEEDEEEVGVEGGADWVEGFATGESPRGACIGPFSIR